MHVLWTPSWYPTVEHPLNGSFFAEQKDMLEQDGFQVGVVTLEPVSLWMKRPDFRTTSRSRNVFRRSFRSVPLGLLPGDTRLIHRQAVILAEEYAAAHGTPDLIHAHSVFPGILLAQSLSDIWGVPFGLTEHRPSSLERRVYGPRYRAIRKAVEQSAFNATVSTEMAEKLTDYYRVPPFEVIALPCSDDFFTAPLHMFSQDSFTFVHVSNMDRNKRTSETIAAFAEVLRTNTSVNLLLIGGNEQTIKDLSAYARSLNIPDSHIEFTGAIPRNQIVHEMSRGDCLVLVSEFEAGGTVFSEAMALSLPLIASATAAGKFATTDETGILVPVDNHHALVEAMQQMIKDCRSGHFNPQTIRTHAYQRSSTEAFVRAHRIMYEQALGENA